MRKNAGLMALFMFVSLPFAAAGLCLIYFSHNKLLAVEAASEQIEFIRLLPHVISPGDTVKMPAFSANSIMLFAPRLSGSVKCSYFEDKISARLIRAEVFSGPFRPAALECVVDARTRN